MWPPPGFSVGVGDYCYQYNSHLESHVSITPFVTVTVPRPVKPDKGLVVDTTVVVLAAPVPVARAPVHNPGIQKPKSVLSSGSALEQPATALSYIVGA